VIFERADDSDGHIGDELRAACVLWLDAAAAVRAKKTDGGTDWPAVVHEFFQSNDYGIRGSLLEEAHRLLSEDEQLIIERCGELDGRNYVLLSALAKTAKANGCLLAAALIWRALIDAILSRGYAKAYGHAARYLLDLRAVSASIDDYRRQMRRDSITRARPHRASQCMRTGMRPNLPSATAPSAFIALKASSSTRSIAIGLLKWRVNWYGA
jgi:hypothetical protein